jgi:hypothetical protein
MFGQPDCERRRLSSRPVRALLIAAALANACGGSIGPTNPTLPVESLSLTGVPTTGTVGDRFPLKATATYAHGKTEDVTARVTWSSSSESTATVAGSDLKLVGAGRSEIRATIDQVAAAAVVSVEPRLAGRSTLAGFVRNRVSARAVANVAVRIVDGLNVDREALTDENGFYSLSALINGSLKIRVTRHGYQPAEDTADLTADTRLDVGIQPLPPPPFTGATFNVRVTQAETPCSVTTPATGRLVLSGTAQQLLIRLTQGRDERVYTGLLDDDGTFYGGAAAADNGPGVQPHGVSSIQGFIVDAQVSGTERITTHLCPGGLGIVRIDFSGSS